MTPLARFEGTNIENRQPIRLPCSTSELLSSSAAIRCALMIQMRVTLEPTQRLKRP